MGTQIENSHSATLQRRHKGGSGVLQATIRLLPLLWGVPPQKARLGQIHISKLHAFCCETVRRTIRILVVIVLPLRAIGILSKGEGQLPGLVVHGTAPSSRVGVWGGGGLQPNKTVAVCWSVCTHTVPTPLGKLSPDKRASTADPDGLPGCPSLTSFTSLAHSQGKPRNLRLKVWNWEAWQIPMVHVWKIPGTLTSFGA